MSAALMTVILAAAACGSPTASVPPSPGAASASGTAAPAPSGLDWHDATQTPTARAQALLAVMTLDEKIGQMTQLENHSVSSADVTALQLGSVLSGGDGAPVPNTPDAWYRMVAGFQQAALATRLGIPILYGVDAVHGASNVVGATIFPHNIGLGATADPELVQRIGRATATELTATGIRWDFGPVVAVPQDVRWGRTYEGYGEDTASVSALAGAFITGLQGSGSDRDRCGRSDGQALPRRRRHGLRLIDHRRLSDRPGRERRGRRDAARGGPAAVPGGDRGRRTDRDGIVLQHVRRQGPRRPPPADRPAQGRARVQRLRRVGLGGGRPDRPRLRDRRRESGQRRDRHGHGPV